MNATAFTAQAGRDQFLQLLVTQLRHQDPLEPVGQEDFLQQLAQFSVVEGIEKLNVRFDDLLRAQELAEGRALIGRELRYTTADSQTPQQGRVEELRVAEGRVQLVVGAQQITLDQIESLLPLRT